MQPPQLTEVWISRQAIEPSFSKGRDYYLNGAVLGLVQRDTLITADVEGSEYEPYCVTLRFNEREVTAADCTCPYDWGGWCKHIVAVALTLLHKPETIEQRLGLDDLLRDLDADQLRTLLRRLAGRRPDILDDVEAQLPLLRTQPEMLPQLQVVLRTLNTPSVPYTVETPAPARRMVQSLLHGTGVTHLSLMCWASGDDPGPSDSELYRAWALIRAGDGNNALSILESATRASVSDYLEMEGWDEEGEAFNGVGPLWTEAVLSAELDAEKRQALQRKLKRWQKQLDNYGYEDVFGAAIEALRQGWDYPPLQRVLAGEITEKGAWDGDAPNCADELAIARLNVLERQGLFSEYLHLAEAEGQTTHFLLMLARLDRVPEIMAYIKQYPCSLDEAFIVAQAMREYEHPEEALVLAHYGLAFGPPECHKARLAAWLSELAGNLGRRELAGEAAIIAFKAAPTLVTYQRALELAGDARTTLCQSLLEDLRARPPYGSREIIEIFLYENLIDDAINALGAYAYYDTVRLVVDAALESCPDWAIQACRKQAEPIMDGGMAANYRHAVEWLAKAREAYRSAGREVEWRQYLQSLLETHARKYKLVPMLRALEK